MSFSARGYHDQPMGYHDQQMEHAYLDTRLMTIVGVWSLVSSRQDMGRTIRGGLAHKIKASTALLGVHCKILYSTK